MKSSSDDSTSNSSDSNSEVSGKGPAKKQPTNKRAQPKKGKAKAPRTPRPKKTLKEKKRVRSGDDEPVPPVAAPPGPVTGTPKPDTSAPARRGIINGIEQQQAVVVPLPPATSPGDKKGDKETSTTAT